MTREIFVRKSVRARRRPFSALSRPQQLQTRLPTPRPLAAGSPPTTTLVRRPRALCPADTSTVCSFGRRVKGLDEGAPHPPVAPLGSVRVVTGWPQDTAGEGCAIIRRRRTATSLFQWLVRHVIPYACASPHAYSSVSRFSSSHTVKRRAGNHAGCEEAGLSEQQAQLGRQEARLCREGEGWRSGHRCAAGGRVMAVGSGLRGQLR